MSVWKASGGTAIPRTAFDLLLMLLSPEAKGQRFHLLDAKMQLHKQEVVSCP